MQDIQNCLPAHSRAHFVRVRNSKWEGARAVYNDKLRAIRQDAAARNVLRSGHQELAEWNLSQEFVGNLARGYFDAALETCTLYGIRLDEQLCACIKNAVRDFLVVQRKNALQNAAKGVPGAARIPLSARQQLSGDRNLPRFNEIEIELEKARVTEMNKTTTPLALKHTDGHGDNQGHEAKSVKGNTPGIPASLAKETIWTKMWSWGAVSVFVSLILAGWMTFMTSEHPRAADGFLLVGMAVFLVKFWTWEEAKRQSPPTKWLLQVGVTLLSLTVAVLALLWNHAVNRRVVTNQLGPPPAMGTKAGENGTAHNIKIDALPKPKPEEQTEKGASPAARGRTISIAERVKIIIAGQLQVNATQLKSNDDFEADLGADPADVYSLMRSLELEYDITIPSNDSKNLHTVGETISYIEKRVEQKQRRQ